MQLNDRLAQIQLYTIGTRYIENTLFEIWRLTTECKHPRVWIDGNRLQANYELNIFELEPSIIQFGVWGELKHENSKHWISI